MAIMHFTTLSSLCHLFIPHSIPFYSIPYYFATELRAIVKIIRTCILYMCTTVLEVVVRHQTFPTKVNVRFNIFGFGRTKCQ